MTNSVIYLENIGISLEKIEEMGMRAVMIDFGGRFRREVFEGDAITICTCAETVKDARIRFGQRTIKNGVETAFFRCDYYLAKNEGLKRVPIEIIDKLKQFNANMP